MSNTVSDIDYAPWTAWRAKDYLAEYYNDILADEQYALSFLCESLKRLPEVSVALDYGCGPTVHHAVALVPKAKEIYLADYLQDNLDEIQRWQDYANDAHDWSEFTRHILKLEANTAPLDSDVKKREFETSQRIKKLCQSDAGDNDPLGPDMRGYFPLVTTHYCAEGATNSKETWRIYMRNIASLVRSGGTLIVSACGAADYYTVGKRSFPCAGVNTFDVLDCLQQNGFVDMDIRVRNVPDHSEQGYSSVIFACATKAGG